VTRMEKECVVKNTGLRGVKVADTRISFIDGEKGILVYRGYRIEDLAKFSTFEEVAWLLLKGVVPSTAELDGFRKRLVEMSLLPDSLLKSMKAWPVDTSPISALMASIAIIGFSDRTVDNDSIEEHEERAVRLIASIASAMVAWDRVRRGLEIAPPLSGSGIAGNILYRLTGKEPDPEIVKA
jgi:citrate synthase